MANKVIVCRCEDVTLHDVNEAVALGYLDIEEVKRFTGLGTGPCQGKECLVATCRVLEAARAADGARGARQPDAPAEAHPFTVRAPVYSVPLGAFSHSKSDKNGGSQS